MHACIYTHHGLLCLRQLNRQSYLVLALQPSSYPALKYWERVNGRRGEDGRAERAWHMLISYKCTHAYTHTHTGMWEMLKDIRW